MSWLDNLLSEGERSARLRSDLPYFAEECLKIRSKSGELIPFRLNSAQLELHKRIEEQKARLGRVRMAILKSRQLGCSSYIAARYYWRAINNPGQRVIIVAHSRQASANIYSMVRRFHLEMPDELRPSTGTSNATELVFDKLDSGYQITVANDEGTESQHPACGIAANGTAAGKRDHFRDNAIRVK
jgi:hypothetical protein